MPPKKQPSKAEQKAKAKIVEDKVRDVPPAAERQAQAPFADGWDQTSWLKGRGRLVRPLA